MTLVGAVAAGLAVALAIVGARGASAVERRLRAIADGGRPRRPRAATEMTAQRIAGALTGLLAGAVASSLLPLGPLPVIAATYAGWVVPALAADRAAGRRATEADRALVTLVEWLYAIAATGRPIEAAVVAIAERPSGSEVLDGALARVRTDYTLGVPLPRALSAAAASSSIAGLARLAERVDEARDLGRALLPLLADLRDELRAEERSSVLERASHVEGRLTLVMTLCYLPALALLVIIPLFLTLLDGLFG